MWGDGGSGQLGYGRVTSQGWPKMTLAACPKSGAGGLNSSRSAARLLSLRHALPAAAITGIINATYLLPF